MQKTQQRSTKLLIIAITTAAIIAAVTTISISAASPAFAKFQCNEDITLCTGGSGCGPVTVCTNPSAVPGGGGGRLESGVGASGGSGGNSDTVVGGLGFHCTPGITGSCVGSGPNGLHPK
jgi:hypothetical protein